jgi:hypothetical protein
MEDKIAKLRVSFVIQLLALFVLTAGFVNAQNNKRLLETSPKTKSLKVAPEQCLKTLRVFLAYVSRSTPDISVDKPAQMRWLTKDLRDAMAKKVEIEDTKAKQNPTDKREFPDNGEFVGAWDYPSTYSIVGSRRYDKVAIIDVEYRWRAGTNYEGDKRLRSFIFLKENESWRLDDIYDFQGQSLKSYFQQTY